LSSKLSDVFHHWYPSSAHRTPPRVGQCPDPRPLVPPARVAIKWVARKCHRRAFGGDRSRAGDCPAFLRLRAQGSSRTPGNKKSRRGFGPKALNRVGLLVNGPAHRACPSSSHPSREPCLRMGSPTPGL
jgi:hypothetical protein